MEENNPKNKNIETYASDVAGILQANEGGVIKKIIEEESASEEAKLKASPDRLKNKLYLYGGIVFLLLAIALVGYMAPGRVKKEVVVEPQFTPIILNDETVFLEAVGDKEAIAAAVLLEARNEEGMDGGLKGIYLTESNVLIGFSRFLALAEANFPASEVFPFREGFLIGTVDSKGEAADNEAPSLFLLLEMQSFTDAFNALRAWEAKMFYDLRDFFGISLTPYNNYLLTKNFEDGIIENKNARILRDNNGEISLMYVFANENFVIVAENENAVREVILRLAGSKIKK